MKIGATYISKNTQMATYLFAWNPKKWDWKSLDESIEELNTCGKFIEKWSAQTHKKIKPGDRAFLTKVGSVPRGIMGSGYVISEPFISEHWSGNGTLVHRVLIEFDVLLNPGVEPILTTELLSTGNLTKQTWTPQSSGIPLKDDIAEELEAVWFDFLSTHKVHNNPFTDHKEPHKIFTEGTPNQVFLTRYERNPYARKKCIDYYGYSCVVCNFNFERLYGEMGKDFIHVHHLNQISDIGKEYILDPIEDLRPICPNCHSIIHRWREPLTIEEMCQLINHY